MPTPKTCAGGAYGHANKCRQHWGGPIGDDGLCDYARSRMDARRRPADDARRATGGPYRRPGEPFGKTE